MIKHILKTLLLLILLNGLGLYAQIPDGYYSTADTSNPQVLKTTLHNIIKDHTKIPYTASTTDTWNVLELADENPNDPNSILDIYKNAVYTKFSGGNDFYNREHSWPKSYGFPNDGSGNYPYTDCHHLFLADSGYNSSRSNKPYDYCLSGCTEKPTDVNNGKGGEGSIYPENSNWTEGSLTTGKWETWIGRRGDVARALFYLAVRYEGGSHGITGYTEPDLELTDDLSLIAASNTGNNEDIAYMGILSVLLEWHEQDPVDDLERHRNDSVYSIQGNRNPFIDHPEWVECIFTGNCSGGTDTTPPAIPTGLYSEAGNLTVSLNWDTNTETDLAGYQIYRSTQSGTGYIKINTQTITSTTYSDTNVTADTTYYYVITATDYNYNESDISSETSAIPYEIPDTIPPVISGLSASSILSESAVISWITDEAADSFIEYGTQSGNYTDTITDSNLVVSRSLTLSGLTPDIEYFYRVSSTDNSGNTSTSGEGSFTTGTVSSLSVIFSEIYYDTAGTDSEEEWIELYNVQSDFADISGWQITDNNGTGAVYTFPAGTVIQGQSYFTVAVNAAGFNILYGYSPDLEGAIPALNNTGDSLLLTNNGGALVDAVAWEGGASAGIPTGWGSTTDPYANTGNSIVRINLNDDTDTYLDWSFDTGNGHPDTQAFLPPVIAETSVSDITSDSALISWVTDKDSDSTVYYGTTSGNLTETVSDSTFAMSHSLILTSLSPDTIYFFTVESKDSLGNAKLSDEFTFTTLSEHIVSDILFSEIYYDTVGTDDVEEWIELVNTGTANIDISGWQIIDNNGTGSVYTFPAGTIIPANSYFTVAADSSGFAAIYGYQPDLTGSIPALNNSGDSLILITSNGDTMDFVAWEGGASSGIPLNWGSTSEPYAGIGNSIVRTNINNDTDTFSDWSTASDNGHPDTSTIPEPPTEILTALSETTYSGTVSGDLTGTFNLEGTFEVITEQSTRKFSQMSHEWIFNVPSSGVYRFSVNAYHTVNSEGDDFIFYYSTDGYNYTPMVIVTSTSDSTDYLTYDIPEILNGTVYILVEDSDNTRNNKSADSLAVDHLFLERTGDAPAQPESLTIYSSSVTAGITYAGTRVKGTASVTVLNENGQPTEGASVTVSFSGSFNETVTGVTDQNGSAVITTSRKLRSVSSFSVCLDTISHTIHTYNPSLNTQECDSY